MKKPHACLVFLVGLIGVLLVGTIDDRQNKRMPIQNLQQKLSRLRQSDPETEQQPQHPLDGNYKCAFTGISISVKNLRVSCPVAEWSPLTLVATNSGASWDLAVPLEASPYFMGLRGVSDPSGDITWWKKHKRKLIWKKVDSNPVPLPQPDDPTEKEVNETIVAFSADELSSIRKFAEALNPPECNNQRADAEWAATVGRFTPALRHMWLASKRTPFRSNGTSFKVPCTAVEGWVRPDGPFFAQPFWSHCCNKGPGIMQCPPGDTVSDPNIITSSKVAVNMFFLPTLRRPVASALPFCSSHLTFLRELGRKPVVYGFGIGGEWDFEDYFALHHGAEVHAFDPTTELKPVHQKHEVPGLSFHYQGLRGASEDINKNGLGFIGGPLFDLNHTKRQLGHDVIDVLKVDCEGCEWESFEFISKDPSMLRGVRLLVLEVHLSPSQGMRHVQDIRRFGLLWSFLLSEGFRLFYLHDNPCPNVFPLLRHVGGLDGRVCAFELSFYREKA